MHIHPFFQKCECMLAIAMVWYQIECNQVSVASISRTLSYSPWNIEGAYAAHLCMTVTIV